MRFESTIRSGCTMSAFDEWLKKEAAEFLAEKVTRTAQTLAPRMEDIVADSLADLPKLMASWIGTEGGETNLVPEYGEHWEMYPNLTAKYLARKAKRFAKRGKHLGGRQGFYSYSGSLYTQLKRHKVSSAMANQLVQVRGSIDGSSWFSVSQKNYRSLKSSLAKKYERIENPSSEIKYEIKMLRRPTEADWTKIVGPRSAEKLALNDDTRPFATPALRYLLFKVVSPRIAKLIRSI